MYFYSDIADLTSLVERESVAIIYISDIINSQVRANSDVYDTIEDRLVGNVSLMEVRGNEEIDPGNLDELEITIDNRE